MAESKNTKENITEREKAYAELKECCKILKCMQPDYDKRDKLFLNYYKKNSHKAVLFFVAFAIVAFTAANSIRYPFLPENLQYIGVIVCFLLFGAVLPAIIFLIQKMLLKKQKSKIDEIEAQLMDFYTKRNLPAELAYKYTNPRVIKKAMEQLEKKRAHSIDEAMYFALADQDKISLFALQRKENLSMDDIALFVAAHDKDI